MAITFVAKGAYQKSSGELSIPPPAGVALGDFLLLLVMVDGADITDTPVGWTPVSDTVYLNIYGRVFWKYGVVGEGNVTIPAYGVQRAMMIAFRGVSLISAFTNNTAQNTTFSAANPTAILDECMLVNCVLFKDDGSADTSNYSSWTNASLVSITEGHDQGDDTGLVGGGIAFAYGIKSTIGAIDATTATTDSAQNTSLNINILLAPIQPSGFFQFIL